MLKNIFSIVFCVYLMSVTTVYAQDTLKVVSLEYRPMVYTENGVQKGVGLDTLMEMAKRANIKMDVEIIPWVRAVAMVKNGEVDGIFPAARTAEREDYGVFMNRPLYVSVYGIFVKKGNEFKYDDINSLAGKRIGIIAGNLFGDAFEKSKKNGLFSVDENGHDVEQNFNKLISGRFDAFVVTSIVGIDTAKRMGILDKITLLPQPLNDGVPQFFFISKKSKIVDKEDVIRSMDNAFTEMIKDGTESKISDKYLAAHQ